MIKFINYFERFNKTQNGIVVDDKVYDISTYYANSLINLILTVTLIMKLFTMN